MSVHEQSHARKIVPGSERSFGLVFATVFAIVALWPSIFHGAAPRLWALGIAAAFGGAAFVVPQVLAPLNRLWLRFGEVLHRITNPVLMGVVYYGTVVPASLILRALGKDLLRLRRDPAASTYWINREPPGPEPGSMTRQF